MHKPLILTLLLALSGAAGAWSREGHELVGELAERRLDPAARAEVRRLLAGEADPSLAGVAAWADDIRAESRSGGHALGERSTRWHYLNFPRGADCEYVPARDCPGGDCVVAAINAQRAILADRGRPLAVRRDALKFLVHFVGDVHQPMHAGFGDDRGGNSFQIQYRGRGARAGEGTNLHRIWDYWLLNDADLERGAYAARLEQLPASPLPPFGPESSREWALESCRLIASARIYPRRHALGDAYIDAQRPLAEARVWLAAQRLAALLNETLAPR